MSHLAIFTLGPLRIELDSAPIQTSRHKALALMVYLTMQRKKDTRWNKVSREALSALLWPEYEQERAFSYLRRTLWEIRSILGEGWIDADREEIGFNPNASIFLDVAEFDLHRAAIKEHEHPATVPCQECIAHLHAAALLYRGDFLSGFSLRDSAAYEDWQFFQREQIRREYASVLQSLALWLYQAGLFTDATIFSQRWLALDTLNEEVHRLLMKIYASTQQRHLAIRQYQQCAQTLKTELGVSPEPATTVLYEAIASGDFQSGIPSAPSQQISIVDSLQTGRTRGTGLSQATDLFSNLPTPTTPLIGRKHEIDQISALLTSPDCWLLTLLGAGGIGKTRIAIEAGREQIVNFSQGVFLVSLSMVAKEHSIIPAIARAVGLIFRQNGPTPEEQLLDYLREKHLLLILDSFEQLVQWASLLEKIHTYAPGVKMLVTSRHRLLLQGEWVLEVTGLDYPPCPAQVEQDARRDTLESYSAVELFLQSACSTRVNFQASADDLSTIVQIVQLLEGNPLALELAASWVNALPCQEIANEIRRGLDLLETSWENIAERQRSMRTVLDHSWSLLSSREQAALLRLAVFRGSFNRRAAEQVVEISLRELSGLVDKSLVHRTIGGRFDLHDLVRQYCMEILERSPSNAIETRSRHCNFYINRLSEWNEQLRSAQQGEVLQAIEADLENIQSAWEWAVHQKQFDYLAQSADALGVFYLRRARFSEGLEAFREASEAVQETPSHQYDLFLARALIWQSALSINLEHFDKASRLLNDADAILTRLNLDHQFAVAERVFYLTIHALLASLQFDSTAALNDYRQIMQLAQSANMKSPRIFIFFWRFLMAGGASRELYLEMQKSLDYVRESGDPFELACILYLVGIGELYHTYRVEKAEPLLKECIQHFQLIGDVSTQIIVLKTQAYWLLVQGNFEESSQLKQQELVLVQNIGDNHMIGITLAEIGEVLNHQGRYFEAEERIQKGLALLKGLGPVEYALRHRYLGDALLGQGKYEEAREAYQFSYRFFQSINEKGWSMTALTGLSRAEFALGRQAEAWKCAVQAVTLYREIQIYTFFVYLTLADIALFLVEQGEVISALEIYQLVGQQGFLAKSRWFDDLFGISLDHALECLSPEEQALVKRNGQQADLHAIIQKLYDCYPDQMCSSFND